MVAADVMESDFTAVAPAERLGDVVDRLLAARYGVLPVVDTDDRLVGLLSVTDVLRAMTPEYLAEVEDYSFIPGTVGDQYVHFSAIASLPVSMIARSEPKASVEASDPLIEVVRVMKQCEMACLPVISGGRVVGIICRTELLRVLRAQDSAAGASS